MNSDEKELEKLNAKIFLREKVIANQNKVLLRQCKEINELKLSNCKLKELTIYTLNKKDFNEC